MDRIPTHRPVAPARDVAWVLRTAVATIVFAAWLVLLLQLALLVRAELVLAELVAESNRFARLPDVRADELREAAHRRAAGHGWQRVRIDLQGAVAPGRGYRVSRAEVPARDALPRALQPLAGLLGESPVAAAAVAD